MKCGTAGPTGAPGRTAPGLFQPLEAPVFLGSQLLPHLKAHDSNLCLLPQAHLPLIRVLGMTLGPPIRHLGQSPHRKTLNLISSAKCLLPREATCAQASGFRTRQVGWAGGGHSCPSLSCSPRPPWTQALSTRKSRALRNPRTGHQGPAQVGSAGPSAVTGAWALGLARWTSSGQPLQALSPWPDGGG